MVKKAILLIYMVLISVISIGQKGLLMFNTKNGLTQNSVTCIFRDNAGFVWIGTQDGLNKFDGKQFKQFKHEKDDSSSLSDQYITAINQDGNGNIWVGTRNGLNLWNPQIGNFQRIHLNKSRKSEIQYAFDQIIKIGKENLIVSADQQAFLWNYQKRVFKKISISGRKLSALTVINNHIWHYYLDGMFYISDENGQLTDSVKPSTIFKNPINGRQYGNKNGIIWALDEADQKNTTIRLFSIHQKEWLQQTITVPDKIAQVEFDQFNNAWIAGQKGLSIIDSKLKKQNFKDNNLPVALSQENAVLCTYPDKEGFVWIGFANHGAGIYNPSSKAFELYKPSGKLETVFTSSTDNQGTRYYGTVSGLYKQEGNSSKLIFKEKVKSLAIDHNKQIWIGVENNGLFVLSNEGKILSHFDSKSGKIADNTIFHIQCHLPTRRVFIASKSGLTVFDERKNEWMLFNAQQAHNNRQLSGSYILHTLIDSKQRIWISSNEGLDVLDSSLHFLYKYPSRSDSSTHIKRSIVTGCAEDLTGNIWISTLSNGVYSWNNGSFKEYNKKSGLSGNIATGLLIDAYNRVWIATTTGMNIYDQTKGQFFTLSEQNGIPTSDFLLSSFKRDNSGFLYWGSAEGLLIIDPQKVQFEPKQHTAFISDVTINYESVKINQDYLLNPNDRAISFEFTSPEFINTEKLIFQYRVKGFEERWITLNKDSRRISFTDLPYSTLQLEFRVAENMTLLSQAPIGHVTIKRNPPFWKNIKYIVPFALLCFVLIIILIKYLLKRKLKEQERKTEIEQTLYKERERISRDLHDNLGAYAAAIKSNIVQLEKVHSAQTELFSQLKENADDMVSALRETIWVMQYAQISVTALSDRFKNLVNRIAPNYPGINFQVKEEIVTERELTPGESIHILRIMQEGLTNALKHASANTIKISIKAGERLEITIEDNGRGFDVNLKEKGHGIQNMMDRAEQAGISIEIKSTQDKGTSLFICSKR